MNWKLLRMLAPNNEPGDGGGAGGGVGTPAPTTPPTPGTPPAGGTTSEPRIDHKEIVGLRTEVRELAALTRKVLEGSGKPPTPATPPAPVTPPAPAAGGDAMAAVDALKFDLALERAMRAAGIPDGPLAELITVAAAAAKPPDIRAYVAQYAKLGGAPAVVAPVVTPPIAPSNTGPPAANPSGSSLPENPYQWGPDVLNKLTVDEYNEAVQKYEQKMGRGNPFAELRRRHETARKR